MSTLQLFRSASNWGLSLNVASCKDSVNEKKMFLKWVASPEFPACFASKYVENPTTLLETWRLIHGTDVFRFAAFFV